MTTSQQFIKSRASETIFDGSGENFLILEIELDSGGRVAARNAQSHKDYFTANPVEKRLVWCPYCTYIAEETQEDFGEHLALAHPYDLTEETALLAGIPEEIATYAQQKIDNPVIEADVGQTIRNFYAELGRRDSGGTINAIKLTLVVDETSSILDTEFAYKLTQLANQGRVHSIEVTKQGA